MTSSGSFCYAIIFSFWAMCPSIWSVIIMWNCCHVTELMLLVKSYTYFSMKSLFQNDHLNDTRFLLMMEDWFGNKLSDTESTRKNTSARSFSFVHFILDVSHLYFVHFTPTSTYMFHRAKTLECWLMLHFLLKNDCFVKSSILSKVSCVHLQNIISQ